MGVPTIKLNDGTTVPGVAYGTGTKWFKGPQKNDGTDLSQPLIDAIKDAISVGFTHIDAAEVYGTDPEIGAVLKGKDRKKLYITNKIFPGLGDIPGSAQKMVDRMGPVDLYLIHAPFFDQVGQKDLKIADAWKAMEDLVAKGVTKSIGVSNFQVDHLKELLASAKIKPAVNQIEFNPYLQQDELVKFCKDNGIVVAAYTPLGPITHFKDGPVDAALKPIAEKYKMTPEQILLKWTSQQGVLTVTTSSSKERLASFLKAVDDGWSLTDEEVKAIADAGAKQHSRKYWGPQFEERDKPLVAAAEAKAKA